MVTLKQVAAEIKQHIRLFTVGIAFYRDGEVSTATYWKNGTGVLVSLNGRHFMLTAGHCIEDLAQHTFAISICDKPHTFQPRFVRTGVDTAGGRDWGYAEIAPADVVTIESQNAVFLAASRLMVMDATALQAEGEILVLYGYPDAVVVKTGSGDVGMTDYYIGSSVTAAAPIEAAVQHVNMDLMDVRDVTQDSRPAVEVPRLRGLSGAGCWNTRLKPSDETWVPRSVRLVGIHVGSTDEKGARWGREILVGHHLRMIAADYPDLRETILGTWPALQTWTEPPVPV
jgi:hypothetical protein